MRGAIEFDPEIELIRHGADDEVGILMGRWQGIDEVTEQFREWLRSWEGLRIEAQALYDLGDRTLVFSRQTGTARLSGVPYEHDFAELITLRDGRLRVFDSYWTREEALRELGISEPDLPDPVPG